MPSQLLFFDPESQTRCFSESQRVLPCTSHIQRVRIPGYEDRTQRVNKGATENLMLFDLLYNGGDPNQVPILGDDVI